jgi:hypothetical protein
MGAIFVTIQCYTETIKWSGHELTDTSYTQNATTIGVVVENKKNWSPQAFRLCI